MVHRISQGSALHSLGEKINFDWKFDIVYLSVSGPVDVGQENDYMVVSCMLIMCEVHMCTSPRDLWRQVTRNLKMPSLSVTCMEVNKLLNCQTHRS